MCRPDSTSPEAGAELRGGADLGRATKGSKGFEGRLEVGLNPALRVLPLQVGGLAWECRRRRDFTECGES